MAIIVADDRNYGSGSAAGGGVSTAQRQRTFMGGTRVSGRMTLFFMLGLIAIGGFGALYYEADRELSRVRAEAQAAQQVLELADRVEKRAWRMRSDEKDFLLTGKAQFVEGYDRTASSITEVLNALLTQPGGEKLQEAITTINEGLAQHATEFGKIVAARTALDGAEGGKGGFIELLEKSASGVAVRVERAKLPGLRDRLARMRRHEADFLRTGGAQDLAAIGKRYEEFNAALASAPISRAERKSIGDQMQAYQTSITVVAKARVTQRQGSLRLAEVFAYMAPNIEGLAAFARNRADAAARGRDNTVARLRLLLPGAAGAILLVLTLAGLGVMRSIAAPVRALARAAGRIAEGERGVALPGLDNKDELGEISRAIAQQGGSFVGADALRHELGLSKAAAERSLAEAARLRRELESLSTAPSADLEAAARNAEAAGEEAMRLRSELAAAKAEILRDEGRIAQLQNELNLRQAEFENDENELPYLQEELDEIQAELQRSLAETQRLRQELTDTRGQLEEAQSAAARMTSEHDLERHEAQAAMRTTDDGAASSRRLQAQSQGPISAIGRELAQSSQTVTAAAYEAERTGSMIRGLMDATDMIRETEEAFAAILEQTNLLLMRGGANLVMLPGKEGRDKHKDDQDAEVGAAVTRRFGVIRDTANHATLTVRDMARTIEQVKEVAMEIASSTSAEALQVTTALLEQSEYLRGMLDDLVGRIKDDGPAEAGLPENQDRGPGERGLGERSPGERSPGEGG